MDLQELRRHVQLESFGTKHFNKVHIVTLLVAFTFRALDSFVQIPFRDANLWCQLKNEWMLATLINWCETSNLLTAYKRKTLSGKSEQSSIASCSLHDNPVCLAPSVRWSCCSGSNSKATGSLPSLQSCAKEALRLRLDSSEQKRSDTRNPGSWVWGLFMQFSYHAQIAPLVENFSIKASKQPHTQRQPTHRW